MPDSSILRHWWEAGYQPLYCLPNEHRVHVPRKGTTGSAPWPAVMPAPPAGAAYRPAVRLPAGVVALDVDCDRPEQPGKDGWSTLERMAGALGPLPATYRLTARGPFQRSGRYLFRVPAGVRLTDAPFTAAGGAVEVIRVDHRFSWAPGDIHPATGTAVVCYDPNGAPLPNSALPHVSALPELPAAWYQDQKPREWSTGPSPAVEKVRVVAAVEWDRAVTDLDALLAAGVRGQWEYSSMLDAAWHLAKLSPEHAVEAWDAAFDRAGVEQDPADRVHITSAVDRVVPDEIVEVDSLFANAPTKARGAVESAPTPVGPTGQPMVVMRRSASSYKTKRAHWLCQFGGDQPRQVPLGEIALVAGKGGCGKSTFTLWMAAELSRGRLPGEFLGKPRKTVIYASEDSIEHTIRPRLIAADADLDMIDFLVRSDGQVDDAVSWTTDLSAITATIDDGMTSLLIIDPLIDAVDGDSHVAKVVRQAVNGKLRPIAQRFNIAIIGLHHLSKNTKDGLGACISGSHAYQDVARAVMVFAYDGGKKDFVFAQIKNSLGRDSQDSVFTYQLESVDVPTDDGEKANVARWVLGEEASDRTVEDAIDSGRRPTGRAGSAPNEDLAWVADALMDGPKTSKELEDRWFTLAEPKLAWATLKNKMGGRNPHYSTRPGGRPGFATGVSAWTWELTNAGREAYGVLSIVDTEPPWTTPRAVPCITP